MISITTIDPDSWGNPSSVHFHNGPLDFILEQGRIRYLKNGSHEILRMVHLAVRDEHWMTVDSTIQDFQYRTETDAISISYEQKFISSTVDFTASVHVRFTSFGLDFSFSGEAGRDFLSNRVGICVLHPITTTAGQACVVTHDDGSVSNGKFPDTISAHQPLLGIRKMFYSTTEGVQVKAGFSGDIFETEDQRNWADFSFKTYSTPLSKPFPVTVKPGNIISQSVFFQFEIADDPTLKKQLFIEVQNGFSKMPALGFLLTQNEPLTSVIAEYISALKPDYLQLEIKFDHGWEEKLKDMLRYPQLNSIPVQLVIGVFENKNDIVVLADILKEFRLRVQSVIVSDPKNNITTQEHWDKVSENIRLCLPDTPTGTGTLHHFSELNRFKMPVGKVDFLNFPVNPQVHSPDLLTIHENLQAMPQLVSNVQRLYPPLPIQISRLTLRYPNDPDPARSGRYERKDGLPWTVDDRQWSLFYGAWLILAYGYLSRAQQICSCDTHGLNGLISVKNPPAFADSSADIYLSPAYLLLTELRSFNPVEIRSCSSKDPLQADGVLFKNQQGEYLLFLVNFSSGLLELNIGKNLSGIDFTRTKMLSKANLSLAIRGSGKWVGGQYEDYLPDSPDVFKLQHSTCHFYRTY